MEQNTNLKYPNINALLAIAPAFETLDELVALKPFPEFARVGSIVYTARGEGLVAFYDSEVEYSDSIMTDLEAQLVDTFGPEEAARLESVAKHAEAFDSLDILERQGKQVIGVIYRVGTNFYHFLNDQWTVLFGADSTPIERHFAAVIVAQYFDVIQNTFKDAMAEISEKIKVAPLFGSSAELAAVKDIEFARIGSEEKYDVYRYENGEWSIFSKSKEEMAAPTEDDTALEARGVSASTAGLVAPAPGEYAVLTEKVDTSYPDMHPNGEQVSREEGARLHVEYLDMQKRVMLTKSFLIACGANAQDGHQLTLPWVEQSVIQKAGVVVRDIAAGDGMQVDGFVALLDLPGVKVEMFDTNYHTLLIRAAHFIATRHDPDTDAYVNENLRKFTANAIRQNATLQ